MAYKKCEKKISNKGQEQTKYVLKWFIYFYFYLKYLAFFREKKIVDHYKKTLHYN